LEQLKNLTSLNLDLTGSQVTSLAGLEQLEGLTSMEIRLTASLVSSFSWLKIRREITRLQIIMDPNTPFVVPAGCKSVGLSDE